MSSDTCSAGVAGVVCPADGGVASGVEEGGHFVVDGAVGSTEESWFDAEDFQEGLLNEVELAAEVGGAASGDVVVTPGVRADCVAGLKCVTKAGHVRFVVDAVTGKH